AGPDDHAPPATGETTVRDEQERQDPAQTAGLPPRGRKLPCCVAAAPPLLRRAQRPALRGIGRHRAHERGAAEQPADRIPRLTRRDQCPGTPQSHGVDGVQHRVVVRLETPGKPDGSQLEDESEPEQGDRERPRLPAPQGVIVPVLPGTANSTGTGLEIGTGAEPRRAFAPMTLPPLGRSVGAMSTGHLLRLGAVAAVAGAVAQLVASLLEPDWGGKPAKAVEVVAGSGFWNGNLVLDLIGVLLTVCGLTVVFSTFADGFGRGWAGVGQPFLVLMAALGASTVAT